MRIIAEMIKNPQKIQILFSSQTVTPVFVQNPLCNIIARISKKISQKLMEDLKVYKIIQLQQEMSI
jgi:hypothetical protein